MSPPSPTRGPELDCFEGFPREAVVMSRRVCVSKSRTNNLQRNLYPQSLESGRLGCSSSPSVVPFHLRHVSTSQRFTMLVNPLEKGNLTGRGTISRDELIH